MNPQEEGCADQFEVSIEGNQMTVKRIDQEAGWEQNLEIAVWGAPPTLPAHAQPIDVGASEENEKVVELPEEGMECNNIPVNPRDGAGFKAKFETSIDGNQMTV